VAKSIGAIQPARTVAAALIGLCAVARDIGAILVLRPGTNLIRVGQFVRIADHERGRLEPSIGSQAISHAIGTLLIYAYDPLQLSSGIQGGRRITCTSLIEG
jgi:hypothetical protein